MHAYKIAFSVKMFCQKKNAKSRLQRPAFKCFESLFGLFYRNRFRQISWLVDIASAQDGDMIGQ